MTHKTIFGQPILIIPFELRGDTGMVSVYYTVNHDAKDVGFDFFHLPFDTSLVHGFPMCMATIDFDGYGYNAIMGWIQLITVSEKETEHVWTSVDKYPIFWETDTPFAEFGYLPTFFDAPGPNPPRANEVWLAETFLVACPDIGKTRSCINVLGFSWGYDLTQMKAMPLPANVITRERWEHHLPLLRSEYSSWEFD